jgi:hypothetical protein
MRLRHRDRPSRDLDVATDSDIPMEDIAAAIVAGLTARGWDIYIIGVDPRSARMTATDPATGKQCELDILKEVFNQPPAVTPYGPVLALYDVIGTKVRALAGRGLPRDLIDIHAASQMCSNTVEPSGDGVAAGQAAAQLGVGAEPALELVVELASVSREPCMSAAAARRPGRGRSHRACHRPGRTRTVAG